MREEITLEDFAEDAEKIEAMVYSSSEQDNFSALFPRAMRLYIHSVTVRIASPASVYLKGSGGSMILSRVKEIHRHSVGTEIACYDIVCEDSVHNRSTITTRLSVHKPFDIS